MSPVEGGFELTGDGVGRGGGEVRKGARRLLVARIQQGLQGLILGKGCWLQVVVIIDPVFCFQCPRGRFLHELPDGGFALAGVAGQLLDDILPDGLGLLVAPQLPVGGRGQRLHLGNASGHIPQNVVLNLLK